MELVDDAADQQSEADYNGRNLESKHMKHSSYVRKGLRMNLFLSQSSFRRGLLIGLMQVASLAGLCAQVTSPSFSSTSQLKEPVPADKVPHYDVILIKPNKTDSGNSSIRVDDGNYDATNITLKGLIASAYGIKEDLIRGLPGWVNSTHYDIKAKILEPDARLVGRLTPEQWRSMLLPMLERFHFKYHIEVKTLPVYELVLAKSGPKFTKSSAEAKYHGVSSGGVSVHNTHLTAHDVTLEGLVNSLSYNLHRTVVDKTGLTGKYDIDLVWSPEHSASVMNADASRTQSEGVDTPPVLVTALQEQLGLKLISSKGPVKTLIVDRADAPTEN